MAQPEGVDSRFAMTRAQCRLEDMEADRRDTQHLEIHMDKREAMGTAIHMELAAHNKHPAMGLQDMVG